MSTPSASAHTHVGTAPPGYHDKWVTHTVHWHGFANLSAEQDVGVFSSDFEGFGNQWSLWIYPGGENDTAEGMTSIYLWNMSEEAIEMDYGFSVNDENGKQVVHKRSHGPINFDPHGVGNGSSRGWKDFATRLTLLSSLVNGTLVIDIQIRLAKPTKSVTPIFIPENPFAKNIQRMIIDENFGDISFAVGGNQKKNNAEKSAKTTPIMFHAHRDILGECSTGIR